MQRRCTESVPTDRRVKEAAEGGFGAPLVAASQSVFGDVRKAARGRQRTSGRFQSLVTFVTSGRRLRPRYGRWVRRKSRPPAASGDVWTRFDSRSGHRITQRRCACFVRRFSFRQ